MENTSSTAAATATGQLNVLKTLLDSIDRKTEPALRHDLELLRTRAARGGQERVLHIAFVVGRHEMALPVSAMQELGEMPTITPLPYLPHWIRGIVQIRGEILSVVDFSRLFQLKEDRRLHLKQAYIFFQQDELQFCLLADRISGILNVDNEAERLDSCSEKEQIECRRLLPYMKGVLVRDERRIFILNNETLGQADLIKRWRD